MKKIEAVYEISKFFQELEDIYGFTYNCDKFNVFGNNIQKYFGTVLEIWFHHKEISNTFLIHLRLHNIFISEINYHENNLLTLDIIKNRDYKIIIINLINAHERECEQWLGNNIQLKFKEYKPNNKFLFDMINQVNKVPNLI